MAAFHSLKRFFPNSPDWLRGGMYLVALLWLVVWPVEISELVIRHDYIPASLLGWSIKFLYAWGFAISVYLISPVAGNSSVPDQLIGICIVLLGLLITSPVYFAIGALLAVRKENTITLAVVLAVIHLVLSCLVPIWLMRFFFSD